MSELQRIIEGALLAAGRPLSIQQIGELFDDVERPEADAIREAVNAIQGACEGRGFELVEVASGYRFQVVQAVAPWVGKLWEEKPQKYSRALLETLALIAYRQPITRGDIEDIRGVAVSTNIIKTLQEREWVRVVGHKDVPGRPAMYATTRRFLDYFNLKNLDELPTLAQIRDLDTMNQELALEEAALISGSVGVGAMLTQAEDSDTGNSSDNAAAEAEADTASTPDSESAHSTDTADQQLDMDADSDAESSPNAEPDERGDVYFSAALPLAPLALESEEMLEPEEAFESDEVLDSDDGNDETLAYSDPADESVNG